MMNKNISLLSKSELSEQYSIVLMSLETIVCQFFAKHPQMHDHDVLQVYESLLKYVKAKITNYPLPESNLSEKLNELYKLELQQIQKLENTFSFIEIQACLKQLEKSVKMWNRELGSQGYLNFVSQFIASDF